MAEQIRLIGRSRGVTVPALEKSGLPSTIPEIGGSHSYQRVLQKDLNKATKE